MGASTKKRFVAFLDILGFKNLVNQHSHEEVFKILNKINDSKENIKDTIKTAISDVEIHTTIFSDSIVFISENDSVDNYLYFLHSVRNFFRSSIRNNIPIKGAISYGEMSIDTEKQIFFGIPLIDASILEEEIQYIGVVAHHSIDKYESEFTYQDNEREIFFNAKTPLKSGKYTHSNLDWFSNFNYNVQEQKYDGLRTFYEKMKVFRNNTTGNSRKYIDNTIELVEANFPSE